MGWRSCCSREPGVPAQAVGLALSALVLDGRLKGCEEQKHRGHLTERWCFTLKGSTLTVEEVLLRLQDLVHIVQPRPLDLQGCCLHDEEHYAAVGPTGGQGQGQAAGVLLRSPLHSQAADLRQKFPA